MSTITINTIPNPTSVGWVEYHIEFTANKAGVLVNGKMDIEYEPKDRLLDYRSFGEYLAFLASQEFATIEAYAQHVFDVLNEALGSESLYQLQVRADDFNFGRVDCTVYRPR